MRTGFEAPLPTAEPRRTPAARTALWQDCGRDLEKSRELSGSRRQGNGNGLILPAAATLYKISYLDFSGSFGSQCGGQGFDPPLLHQKIWRITAAFGRLF